ncbi:ABC transporter permease subunit [Cellulomonas sp. APG4]|uniref:ABC transporter permease subunit n=1 Tax=Cellulomonas sp. APG4 TaxID=1538656 RepID=UPI00137AD7D8|nr:ABC transporter permease subunit [Cellulomonas sp. APG4]NCT91178.1 ABC transporter permease subunit [Cellulomonas sp. APG4]
MTTTTVDSPAVTSRPRTTGSGPTFGRVLTAEWIKFRSLRSTVWTSSITVLVMVGLAFLMASLSTAVDDPSAQGIPASAAPMIVFGYYFGQLALAVLGVLVITGEYSTGMIRSTLTAVPKRLPALWAKALVAAVVGAVVATVAIALSALVTLPYLDGLGMTFDLSDGETLRVLGGGVLYLATITVFSLAVGAILRHTAAALATVLGLLLVVETVFQSIPHAFFQNVSPFLPGTAGSKLMMDDAGLEMAASMTSGPQLTPWQGYGVMLAWVVVLLATAAVLLRRRAA